MLADCIILYVIRHFSIQIQSNRGLKHMKDLIDKFNELKNEYHNSTTTDERKVELFQEMKECLIQINGNEDQYVFKRNHSSNIITQIRQCTTPSELYDIMGDISASLSSDKLTEIAAMVRQMGQNQYDKNNPYPYK